MVFMLEKKDLMGFVVMLGMGYDEKIEVRRINYLEWCLGESVVVWENIFRICF